MKELSTAIKAAVKELFKTDIAPELSRPDEKFGDFATNVALQLAKKTANAPNEIADKLITALQGTPGVAQITKAGPGFINFKITDGTLAKAAFTATDLPKPNANQEIVAEYSDPNPFKVLHVGHLYTSVIGDAISNLLQAYGANVHRVNFGGDVGLHVAKTMWSIIGKLGGENPEKLADIPVKKRAKWLAEEYVTGSLAYGDDERINGEIKDINKRIYDIHEQHDKTSPLARIYWATRQWSYDYFDEFYERIGTKFEKYYPESATFEPGLEIVKANIGKVFEESDGAIVFKGEVHNLHTRVFVNSEGLPTYETKDLGLIRLKDQDYRFDRSIIITGNEQAEYMQVVLKALDQIKPDLARKTTHITHGLVKLPGSQKMSSRHGNIIGAEAVLDLAREANKTINGQDNEVVSLAAVKYAFLHQRPGADIIYDPAESVSIEGNSGPYLQYAHSRAQSILSKAQPNDQHVENIEYDSAERTLARKISEYPEVVQKAVNELMPHHVANYLYELAQQFNRFYETSRIIDDERETIRLQLVAAYQQVLKNGLNILNINAPERM